jgi:hypothetical protein
MDELAGQDSAQAAMAAAWPHLTVDARRRVMASWLRESVSAAPSDALDVARGPALDAYIGVRR